MATTAPQITKAHWDEAYRLFLQRLGDSKKLQKPLASSQKAFAFGKYFVTAFGS